MHRRMRGTYVVLVTLILSMAVGCGLNKNEIANIYKNLGVFHQALNKGDYAAIIRTTDVEFRKSSQQDDLVAPFRAVHEKYGRILDSVPEGYDVRALIGAARITFHQHTRFEHGVLEEHFTYMVRDHEPFLLRYEVKPITTP